MRLMYQNSWGITGLPALRLARNCTPHRAPNISAPARPMTFQGVITTPNQDSHSIGVFTAHVPEQR